MGQNSNWNWREHYDKQIERGICVDCGKENLSRFVACDDCRKKKNEYFQNLKANRLTKNLCVECAKPKEKNRNLCPPCLLIRRMRNLKLPRAETKKAIQALEEFNGVCQCCGKSNPGRIRGWVIDHCHSTKTFRGILCQNCNLMLGCAADNPIILNRGIQYLRGICLNNSQLRDELVERKNDEFAPVSEFD